MMVFGISVWWVLLAAVVYFALGAVWYSPVAFMKQWQREIKKKQSEMNMAAGAMMTTLLAIVVLVCVEAYLIKATGTTGMALRGGYLGLKLWVGFVATTALINNVFQNGSKKLYAIDQGYHLLGMILAAAILAH
jgi:hypothetical protein